MDNIINNFLLSNGFNDTDIKIYQDLYKYGRSYASSIALRIKVDRTTVYSALKRLISKGFVIQTKSKEVRSYMAMPPEIWLDKIDNEMEKILEKKKMAELFIDSISKTKLGSYARPKINIYEGDEAIINLYEQSLVPDSEQKSFLTIQKIPEALKDFLVNKFIKTKLKKNVHSKVIIKDTSRSQKYASLDHKSNRQTKIIKNHPFDLQSEILLFDNNKVAIIDFGQESFGTLIESLPVYKTMETLFDYIWESEK